jgi:hypothetical protein
VARQESDQVLAVSRACRNTLLASRPIMDPDAGMEPGEGTARRREGSLQRAAAMIAGRSG